MRALVATAVVVAGCAADGPSGPPLPDPLDQIWSTIHAGDTIVLVPGTGAYDYLAASIEPLPGSEPLADVRSIDKLASDAIVFEQAIAAAHRAGIDPGTLTFDLWGAGFTRLTAFDYASYEGLVVPIHIIGGENSCARGRVIDNLLSYSVDNAKKDATDLYARIVAAQPSGQVIVASHSWGGAVAEYLAFEYATITGGNAAMPFTIAAGVPGYLPGYVFAGPSFRDLPQGALYEIDRPDDPVHAMNPSGNPDGHQYDILFGDEFRGSYGITTADISCKGVPGPCT